MWHQLCIFGMGSRFRQGATAFRNTKQCHRGSHYREIDDSRILIIVKGAAGNIGAYGVGIPAGILIDNRGTRIAVLIGATLLACGYFPIHTAYANGPGSMSVGIISFCSFLTGAGSCTAFSAAIKTCACLLTFVFVDCEWQQRAICCRCSRALTLRLGVRSLLSANLYSCIQLAGQQRHSYSVSTLGIRPERVLLHHRRPYLLRRRCFRLPAHARGGYFSPQRILLFLLAAYSYHAYLHTCTL